MIELINAVMYELLFLIAVLLGYAFFGGINFVSSKILWGTLISLLMIIPIYTNRALNIFNPSQTAFFSIMLLILLVKKESAKKLIALYPFIFVMIDLLNLNVMYIFRFLFHIEVINLFSLSPYSAFTMGVSLLVLLLLFLFRKQRMDDEIVLSNKQLVSLYTILVLTCMMIFYVNHYQHLIHPLKDAALLGFFSVFSAIILNFLGVYQVILAQNYSLLEENFRLQQQFHSMQDVYFENILHQSKQTRNFRHDMKAHFQTIAQIAQEHNDQAVMNYLDEIAHLFHFDKQYFYTGNQIIDILLTNLTEKARENNITVNIEGIIPKDLNVDSVDLTIICYNLLQNALEATILEKNDFFNVSCSIKNQQFIFVVKNKVSNEISIENGLIQSQKADEKNHGLGLKNVRDAVERSKGIFDINVKNQQFIARVVLPLD